MSLSIARAICVTTPLAISLSFATAAQAVSVATVLGTDDIFAAGQTSVPGLNGGGGTLPGMVPAFGGEHFQFSASGFAASGADSGQNHIAPDGGTNPGDLANIGSPSSSGINLSGYVGPDHPLAGVFIADSLLASPPATLDFTSSGIGSSFTSLSPALGQIFFIGDDLTGTGTGSVQDFLAPSGATRLFLGMPDGSYGLPGYYFDNGGSWTVTVTAVPEPGALGLLAVAGVGLLARHRKPQ